MSGVIYCSYAEVLEDLVTDWCVQKRSFDSQFGFYLGRSTLDPLFIFVYCAASQAHCEVLPLGRK